MCFVCVWLRGNCSALGWRGWEAVVSDTWGSCLPAQLVNDFTGRVFVLRHLLRKQLSNRFWRHHNATSNDLEQIQVGFRYKQAILNGNHAKPPSLEICACGDISTKWYCVAYCTFCDTFNVKCLVSGAKRVFSFIQMNMKLFFTSFFVHTVAFQKLNVW